MPCNACWPCADTAWRCFTTKGMANCVDPGHNPPAVGDKRGQLRGDSMIGSGTAPQTPMRLQYGVNESDSWWHFALGENRERLWARLRELDVRIIRLFVFDKHAPDPVADWPSLRACIQAVLNVGRHPFSPSPNSAGRSTTREPCDGLPNSAPRLSGVAPRSGAVKTSRIGIGASGTSRTMTGSAAVSISSSTARCTRRWRGASPAA